MTGPEGPATETEATVMHPVTRVLTAVIIGGLLLLSALQPRAADSVDGASATVAEANG